MRTTTRLRAPIILPCDQDCSVLRDAVLDVDEAGRIVHCGPESTAPALPNEAEILSYQGILLPGMINAHAHTPMTLLRGLGGDLPLIPWLREAVWPTEARLRSADVYAGMLLGSVEMLRAGVTTSAEMYFHNDRVVDAVLATGSRAVITPGVISAPGWDRLGTWQEMLAAISGWIDADGLRFGPADRIELGYGPHSAYTLPPEALVAASDEAKGRNALLHIHVAESAEEDAAQRAEHGSVPALLDKLGVLGGRVLVAHGVHLSDADITLFARHGVGVAHCPGSNAKLAAGIFRLDAVRAAGLAVGLGTDGPASNDDLDLWEEVRLAALLARLSTSDAAALTASDALLLATRGGADVLGRNDIGVLEPGRWADVVHVSVDGPAFAAGLDVSDGQLIANLVWAAGARCVRDVWVAGEQVLADAEPTRVDRDEVQAEFRQATLRLR